MFRESVFSSGQAQDECHLEKHCILFRWIAVSRSHERSESCSPGSVKVSIKGINWDVKKKSIIILQNKAFLNTANVTGSWQHYLGIILSKRATPQCRLFIKPWYVIFWNGKMREKSMHRNSEADKNQMHIITREWHIALFPLMNYVTIII